jgi:hypothetical protein
LVKFRKYFVPITAKVEQDFDEIAEESSLVKMMQEFYDQFHPNDVK